MVIANVAINIPVWEQRKDFMTDQARLARACRPLVKTQFVSRTGGPFECPALIDTGAPFSVVPFSIWNDENLAWQLLGHQLLTLAGQLDQEALTWLGVPCYFGEVRVALLDESKKRTRSLHLIGKLPCAATSSHLESQVILGYNFLADNSLTLILHPASKQTIGSLANVAGFLTGS